MVNRIQSLQRRLNSCSKSQRPKWLYRLRRALRKQPKVKSSDLTPLVIFVWNEHQLVPANVYRAANCPTAVIRVSKTASIDRDKVVAMGNEAIVYHFR